MIITTAKTDYQILKEIAALPDSGCGLDRNIYGKFTLGSYTPPYPGNKFGDYYQIERNTPEEIRSVAKRLKFKTVLDRVWVPNQQKRKNK